MIDVKLSVPVELDEGEVVFTAHALVDVACDAVEWTCVDDPRDGAELYPEEFEQRFGRDLDAYASEACDEAREILVARAEDGW